MSKLFQCDKCKEQVTEPLKVGVVFERTPEEIKQLMTANDAPLGAEDHYKKISMVDKTFDFCRKCYDKFIKEWNV